MTFRTGDIKLKQGTMTLELRENNERERFLK